MKDKTELKEIIKDTLPVAAGYIALGIGFGVLLRVNGYGLGWAVTMSILMFAGSMQYAAVGLIASGASLITFAITTIAVNIRHVFYGLSMIDKYKNVGKVKPYLIYGLTDETYALVSSKERDKKYYTLVTLFDNCYWVLGSALGSIIGSAIKFDTTGIDFVLTALFITIFVEQWMSRKDHFPAVIGVAVSVLSLLAFGPDGFLVPAMIGILAVLIIRMKRHEHEKVNDAGQSDQNCECGEVQND